MNKKQNKYVVIASLLTLAIAVPVHQAHAGVFSAIQEGIASFFNLLSSGVGFIMMFLLNMTVQVAQYNGFIESPAVELGWKIVRDVCNMFFILILLVIAFATILRLDGYNWKKDLPRLLLYAVLINFSKTICGLIIDFSQVIMLTFVNAVATNGANNLAAAFQVDKYQNLDTANLADQQSQNALTATQIMIGAIAGFLAIIVTFIMTIAILTTLVMRVVYIWIYVILSPAAYLMNAFSGGKSYANQWWSKFTKELIGGPVLAFFLWLALAVANNEGNNLVGGAAESENINGVVKLFTQGPFQKYIIVIGLLYGGMQVAQQVGGAAGKAAGTAMKRTDGIFDRTKRLAKAPVSFAGEKVMDATRITAAREAYKNWQGSRKAERDLRIKGQTAQLQSGLSNVIRDTKAAVGRSASWATGGWLPSQARINELSTDEMRATERARQLRNGGAENKVVLGDSFDRLNAANGSEFTRDGERFWRENDQWHRSRMQIEGNTWNRLENGLWVDQNGQYRTEDHINNLMQQHGVSNRVNPEDAKDEYSNSQTFADVIEQRALAEENNARTARDDGDVLRNRARRIGNVIDYGAPIAAIIGAMTGLAPLAVLAGSAAAAKWSKNGMIDSTERYFSGEDRNERVIEDHKKLLDKPSVNNGALNNIVRDDNEPAHRRMAAMELMIEKGVINSDNLNGRDNNQFNVGQLRQNMIDAFGGPNDAGDFSDAFIKKRFNSNLYKAGMVDVHPDSVASRQQGDDGFLTDGARRAAIRQESAVTKNDVKMADVNAQNLAGMVDRFVDAMKPEQFAKEAKDLDGVKLQNVIEGLTRVISDNTASAVTIQKAREKLALVQNPASAYRTGNAWNMDGLSDFMNSVTSRYFQNLRDDGSNTDRSAVREAILEMAQAGREIPSVIRGFFGGNSTAARTNRRTFGFSPEDRRAVGLGDDED